MALRLRILGNTLRRTLDVPILIALLGVLLMAVIWVGSLYVIRVDEQAQVRAASDSSRELIETYEAQMNASLRTIDQTLRTIKYAFELHGDHVHSPSVHASEAVLDELREKGLLPPAVVFTTGIADAEGRIVAGARSPLFEQAIAGGLVARHFAPENDGPFVTTALRSPDGERDYVLFSLRLADVRGEFAGAAMLAVGADYFTSGYDRARVGDRGVLALLGSDGRIIVRRSGELIATGADAGQFHSFAGSTDEGDEAVRDAEASPWDGERRFLQARPLFGYPLAVMVGLSEQEQLQAFEQRRSRHLWEAVVASVLLGIVIAVLGGLSWQLAATRLHRRKEQETYYAATNASLDGFFVLKACRNSDGRIVDFETVDANPRAAAFLGRSKEGAIGMTLAGTFPDMRESALQDFVAVAETGVPSEKEWENRLPSVRARWLYRQVVRVDDGVVLIVRDITERKQAEILQREQGRALEMIAKGTPLETVLESLLLLAGKQLGTTKGAVMLVDAKGERFVHGAAIGLPKAWVSALSDIEIRAQDSAFAAAVSRAEAVFVSDIAGDPTWNAVRRQGAATMIRSCAAVPVSSQHQSVLGAFTLYLNGPAAPSEAQIGLMQTAARIAGLAIERKQAEDRIRHLAQHDALTGLPNRALLRDRLDQAILQAQRHQRQVAVAFLDLDHFKLVNDTLGHNAGDELLKAVAERMKQCVRSTDTVVRLGGDEFVVVVADLAGEPDGLTPILEKLLAAISTPVMVAGHELRVNASMGLALYPGDGATQDALLMNADAAMYRAKELGRNNYQFYTAEMNARVRHKLEVQEGLRNALQREEFFLQYQPQMDIGSGRIVGVEALVRWRHPQRGLVAPNEFIPAAEESGLIVGLGDWVMRTACAQNKGWQEAGMPAIVVAVNVSARQFRDRAFATRVLQVLHETGLEPQYLELELTESMIMEDLQQAVATMSELQAMGVQLSIDDFGTGYSSLSALKSFPIARLKLDRSFVRDLPQDEDDKAIAMAVISLGHKLDLRVLAEGVETAGQLAFLRDNECDEMQGYFFSKPVGPEEVALMLAQDRPQGTASVHISLSAAHR